MAETYTPHDVAVLVVEEARKRHWNVEQAVSAMRADETYETDLDAAEAEVRRQLGEVQEYRPVWSWDDCGCIAPEKVRVLANGRAIAYYESDAPVPYRNLEALVDAHCSGGDCDVPELFALLGEPEAKVYEPGELFKALRQALKSWGHDSVAGGYRVGQPDAPGISVACASPRPSSCAPAAVDLDVEVTLPDGKILDGEVTLSASQYDGQPTAFGGGPQMWVSGGLLEKLEEVLSEAQLRELLGEMEVAASREIPGRWETGRYVIDPDVLSKVEG